MLNNKSLPWSNLAMHASSMNKKVEFSKLLEERLNIHQTVQLFNKIPKELHVCLKKVLQLNFDETPNYSYYKEQLAIMAAKLINPKLPQVF
jgi:hypothetical protein